MYRHILIPTDGSELAWRGVTQGLALSWHGRSGLSTLLIGSVTNNVLTYAKPPVLVCR